MSKYLYTPQDIALFFDYCDFKLSDEKMIKEDLWENRNIILEVKYRKDKYKFFKEITRLGNLYNSETYKNDIEIINRVFKEVGSKYEIDELKYDSNYIETFFRFIKLRLTYVDGCTYVRLKLKTLLAKFGYKRRSVLLVNDLKRTMKALQLKCYLKDYEICDIGKIKLDDTLIIRLKV